MCVCVNCFLHEVFQFRSEPLCLSSVLLVSTSGMHVYTSSMHVFDVICGALLSCALRLALRLLPDAVNPTACHFITASNTPHGYTRVQSCRNFFSLQLLHLLLQLPAPPLGLLVLPATLLHVLLQRQQLDHNNTHHTVQSHSGL